jgi:hypothetical protein
VLELPLVIAAQLAALQEMHKSKSDHQVLIDLIALGLARVEAAAQGTEVLLDAKPESRHEAVYLLNGPFAEFHHLVVKHHRRMEREAAGDDPELAIGADPYDLNDDTT